MDSLLGDQHAEFVGNGALALTLGGGCYSGVSGMAGDGESGGSGSAGPDGGSDDDGTDSEGLACDEIQVGHILAARMDQIIEPDGSTLLDDTIIAWSGPAPGLEGLHRASRRGLIAG